MKRKQFLVLGGCLISCLGILIALYAFSPLSKGIHRASFNRKFLPQASLAEKAVLDMEFNSFYIAGITQDKIYLGNTTAPFHLLMTNMALTDSQHVNLQVQLDSIKEPRRFELAIDSPYFFLSHGTMPEVLRGRIGDWIAKRFLPDNTDFFVEAVPIGPASFALRSYSTSSKGYELAKKSPSEPFRFNFDLLQKQIDGLFCVDGKLHYNKKQNQLVYLHYYRNEFLVIDTNLNLKYRSHTIDTFSHARIKVAKIGAGNESMLSAPPMQVNGNSCVFGKYLFVRSNLLANNESIEDFIEQTIIDMYDLTDGSYVHSFYIPSYQHEKPSDFAVFDNRLLAIFDQYLVLYEVRDSDPQKDDVEDVQ